MGNSNYQVFIGMGNSVYQVRIKGPIGIMVRASANGPENRGSSQVGSSQMFKNGTWYLLA